MSLFRRLSLFSKKNSVPNAERRNYPPPPPSVSSPDVDEESNTQSGDVLMTACLGSKIGKGTVNWSLKDLEVR